MKTKIKLTSLILLCTFNFLIGQKNTENIRNFYIYRNEADFFNKKETLFGKSNYEKAGTDYYDLNNVKYKTLDLSDSSIYGFKVEHLYDGQVVPRGESFKRHQMQYIKIGKSYVPFCGGNKNYFVTSALDGSGTYDADGFINSDFLTYGNYSQYGTNYIEFWFHDKVKNITTKNIEEILVNNPVLNTKYLAEKSETDKKVWKRNKNSIDMKYFKLYSQSNPK